ncbi:MAG: DNA repair protein RadA [Lachnospiraceae bacterium]|nr:DNA repair protein RadA [Lachnospiraceae bacterium]
MAKARETQFFCKECGYESSKWLGQCPGCKQWNSFVEAPVAPKAKGVKKHALTSEKPVTLSEISIMQEDRVTTGIEEFDRVLGGGIVPASLILVGGDPGIGKSTLLLQVCKHLSDDGHKVLYITGEESLKQIKLRANRLGDFNDNLLILCETNLDLIEAHIRKTEPEIVIIDSIQTMFREDVAAAAGSVSQVRESTNMLLQLAKGLEISIFIVGHVTKEGVVAGPRVLEHMVDTVLYFEGDRHASYRILRGVKNRFGSTNEIGVFEMRMEGLSEVKNPSEFLLQGRPENTSGSVAVCLIEGTRPLMVEIQGLVSKSGFGMARRTAAGTDYNRVNLLIAVLEKRLGINIADCDAYVNIAGGMKVSEPALDLGLVVALLSSYKNKIVPVDVVVFGEVGLSGEVRAVSMAAQRVAEAAKLGFKTCILPKASLEEIKGNKSIKGLDKMNLIGISTIGEIPW